MKKKILISAIEVSADMHAANLVKAIKKINSNIDFLGLGSEALAQCGVKVYRDLTHKSTVGLLEPLKHIFSFLSALKLLQKLMVKEKPAAFFCIDGQGFHLLAAKTAQKLGIPVIYYIAPQEWLWGTEAGGKKVASLCNLIISIFPEECSFYQKFGVKSVYNGHPLTDIVKPNLSRTDFFQKYNLNSAKLLLTVFPGSRIQELKHLVPIFQQTCARLTNKFEIVFVGANQFCFNYLKTALAAESFKIILQDNYNAMAASDFVLSSTGTITLEAALIGTPILAVYKLSAFSYWLLCKTISSRMPKYKALPNMLAQREIMPEIIQDGVNADNLEKKINYYFSNPEQLANIRQEFLHLKTVLNKKDVLLNNAKDFLAFLKI